MFTGIIEGLGTLTQLLPFTVIFPSHLLQGLETGASVAVDGVCLTVTSIEHNHVFFDLSEETKQLTTLQNLLVGNFVNLERAATMGKEIGGHFVSGHVCGCVTLLEKGPLYLFSCPSKFYSYLFYKGFVALNGVSLTIASLQKDCFGIALIPETLKRTTFGQKQVGDSINLEWDMMSYAAAETARRIISAST
ncbi:MAG: riboflavin synthase subunit alpha [Verrucomicrobia bacterium]|nr:riboflavin synthase subunit alpha [Verrucomicrobiota bacterium]MBS0646591.1 riboflavin synthase subunit alpha [Verrucomicrobiota bacterium]